MFIGVYSYICGVKTTKTVRVAYKEVNMGQTFKISDEQWRRLNDATLRIVLERSDKLVASSLEQLRKSTDRAYTLFGFLLTVFSGVTAYLIRCVDITVLLPCVVLWLGLGIATALMFSKAIWVHPFIHQGNQPRYLITKELIDAYKSNGAYLHMLLVSAIEENQYCYDYNSNILEKRTKVIKCVMKVIKATFLMVAVITILIKLAEYLNYPLN